MKGENRKPLNARLLQETHDAINAFWSRVPSGNFPKHQLIDLSIMLGAELLRYHTPGQLIDLLAALRDGRADAPWEACERYSVGAERAKAATLPEWRPRGGFVDLQDDAADDLCGLPRGG